MCVVCFQIIQHIFVFSATAPNIWNSSNYNRANDVAVCVAVCATRKTADVTVTKIAGKVRVRILTNR